MPKNITHPRLNRRQRSQAVETVLIVFLVVSFSLEGCADRELGLTDERSEGTGGGSDAGLILQDCGSVLQDCGAGNETDATVDAQPIDSSTGDDDAIELFTAETTTVIHTRKGQVYAWGREAFLGALPNDSQIKLRLLDVPDGVTVGVVAGNFLCVLLDDGDVWCATGAGYATDVEQGVPLTKVSYVPGHASSIAAAAYSPFVVTSEEPSTVYSWSYWYSDDPTVLKSVSLPTEVASVAPGANHRTALTLDGDVYWWGQYWSSDTGPVSEYVASQVPVHLEGVLAVKQLASGFSHTCALTTSGRVYCWGNNDDHQLGHNVPWVCEGLPCHMPVAQAVLPETETFVKLATRDSLTAAISASGGLWAWGRSMADNCAYAGAYEGPPKRVEGVDDVVDVSVGASHICVIKKDFTVWCWGDNTDDQAWPYANGWDYCMPTPRRVWPPN